MEHSARIFNCARCHNQVIICGCCDRGNIYCGSTCSQESRKESHRKSDKRYQDTYRGRLNHANRQKSYRERKQKIVTDHGSKETTTNDLLQFVANEGIKVIRKGCLHCQFCGRSCSQLLRTLFLYRERIVMSGAWPLGPVKK
jgi:hypothetical protein